MMIGGGKKYVTPNGGILTVYSQRRHAEFMHPINLLTIDVDYSEAIELITDFKLNEIN